jgi:hypothetical protein
MGRSGQSRSMDEPREAPGAEPAPASEPVRMPMPQAPGDPTPVPMPPAPADATAVPVTPSPADSTAEPMTASHPGPSEAPDAAPVADDEATAVADDEATEAALDEYEDGLLAAEVRAAVESSDAVDATFSATLDPASVRFGEATPTKPVCQWCNADLPSADLDRCPSCKVALKPVEGHREVPGLTTVSSEAQAAIQRIEIQRQMASVNLTRADGTLDPDLITVQKLPVTADILGPETTESYQPPSAEVREMMRRIKWEAFEADPLGMIDPGPLADRRSQREENTL